MTRASGPKVGPADLVVLRDLWAAVWERDLFGLDPWLRPMDCGGRSSSQHSYRLSKLERAGLVASKVRSVGQRGSKLYTITPAGRAAAANKES